MNSDEVIIILIKQFNKKIYGGRWYCPCKISNRHRMTCVLWLILRLQKTVNSPPPTENTPHLSREALSRVWTVPAFTLGPVTVSSTSSLFWTILYRDFTTHKLYCAAKGEICPNSNILFTWILFLSGSSFHLSNLDSNTRGKSHKSEDKRIIKRTVP